MLSEDFATVRHASGIYKHTPAAQQPGMHEIRALGSHLYSNINDQTTVMNAMAHSDIEMTQRYQTGHSIEDIEIGLEELTVQRFFGGVERQRTAFSHGLNT